MRLRRYRVRLCMPPSVGLNSPPSLPRLTPGNAMLGGSRLLRIQVLGGRVGFNVFPSPVVGRGEFLRIRCVRTTLNFRPDFTQPDLANLSLAKVGAQDERRDRVTI